MISVRYDFTGFYAHLEDESKTAGAEDTVSDTRSSAAGWIRVRSTVLLEMAVSVLVLSVHNAWADGCANACKIQSDEYTITIKSELTGSTRTEAATETIAPVSTVSIDWHILCVTVASATRSDDHSVLSGGLVVDSRHV